MKDIIIDGYNLLHAMGVLQKRAGPAGLEQARARLLGLLDGSFEGEAITITVVFDAQHAPKDVPRQTSWRGIHIHFARDEEADDAIEELISEHSAPKNLTVVSDDHRLRRAAARGRANSMGCRDFLNQLLTKRRQRSTEEPPEKITRLSDADTQKLLEEFADADEELRREFKQFDFGE